MSGDDSIIKNPARNSDTAEHEKYTPQYRILGVNPQEVNYAARGDVSLAKEEDFLDEDVTTRGTPSLNVIDDISNISIPNVGNNTEQLWTTSGEKDLESKDTDTAVKDGGKYVVIAKDQIIFIGSLKEVENEIRKIFYEEHRLCKSMKITIDDVVVLKKVKIKVGVFLEE
jgi:hypothetical protein